MKKRIISEIETVLCDYISDRNIITIEEATVHVKDVDMLVTVQLLKGSRAVLSR